MRYTDNMTTVEARTGNTGFASGGVTCKFGALCPARAGFNTG